MMHKISDRDGDEIEIEALPDRGIVWLDFPDRAGDYGNGRALTIDQCAALIEALTNAAKELGR